MTRYGAEIVWTNLDGTRESVRVGDCATFEEATREVVRLATRSGWTPPKWWEFWRWGDTRPEKWNDSTL